MSFMNVEVRHIFTDMLIDGLRPFVTFRNKHSLRGGVVSPTANPQAGGPFLSAFRDCLLKHIRSYPAYLEGPVEGSCEHGNEPSGSIKRWEILH
jgi:hypothetical protein